MYALLAPVGKQLLIVEQGKAYDVTEFLPGTRDPAFVQRAAAGLTLSAQSILEDPRLF